MSGEVVVIPRVPSVSVTAGARAVGAGARGAGAGAGAAGRTAGAGTKIVGRGAVKGAVGAAHRVQALVDQRVERARAEAAKERGLIAEWQQEQAQQRQAMRDLARQMEAVRQAQQRLMQASSRGNRKENTWGEAQATGYMEPDTPQAQREEASRRIAEIERLIDVLPRNVLRNPEAPFAKLQQQVAHERERLQRSEKINLTSVTSLRATVQTKIDAYLAMLEDECQDRTRLKARAAEVWEQATLLSHLTNQHADALIDLQQRITTLHDSGKLTSGALDTLEASLADIRTEVERSMTREAARPVLAEAVTRHLEAMDYEIVSPFPANMAEHHSAQAVMRIPGGEQVQVTLRNNGRLDFKLRHEQSDADGDSLDEAEAQFVREQESQWCQDVHELVRRLAGEGFSCGIPWERQLPERSIPVVRMETPDEWAEQAEDEARLKRLKRQAKGVRRK